MDDSDQEKRAPAVRGDADSAAAAEPVSWIEAALRAATSGGGPASGARARRALQAARPSDVDEPLETWLEAFAEAAKTEPIAQRIVANPDLSLRAHRKMEGDALGNLLRGA